MMGATSDRQPRTLKVAGLADLTKVDPNNEETRALYAEFLRDMENFSEPDTPDEPIAAESPETVEKKNQENFPAFSTPPDEPLVTEGPDKIEELNRHNCSCFSNDPDEPLVTESIEIVEEENNLNCDYFSDDTPELGENGPEAAADEDSPAEAAIPLPVEEPGQPRKRWKRWEEMMHAEDLDYDPWIIQGILPEGLTLLVGRPKLGKSWLAMNISYAVASGKPLFGRCPIIRQGDVYHLGLEDNDRRFAQRIRSVLQGDPPPKRAMFGNECPLIGDGALEELQAWIDAVDDPRLIVIDTFACIKPFGGRKNAYEFDYKTIRPLQQLAMLHHLAIVLVHHDKKGEIATTIDAANGSRGITGAGDTVLYAVRDDDDDANDDPLSAQERKRYDVSLKIRGRETGQIGFDVHCNDGRFYYLGKGRPKGMNDRDWEVFKILRRAENPLQPNEIKKLSGALSTDQVKRALKSLKAMNPPRVKSSGGCYAIAV